MGFVENPIFDFDIYYIDCNIVNYLNNDDYEEDSEYEDDDIEPYATFNYITNDIYERYSFDEKLKEVYFKKK